MQIVCELPASTNWNFDVHWFPRIPGVITASSFDGKIGIHNVEVHPSKVCWVFTKVILCAGFLRIPSTELIC